MQQAFPDDRRIAFQGAMFEVNLEDVLASMLVTPDQRAMACGDHRFCGPSLYDAAMLAVERLAVWYSRPKLSDLAGPALGERTGLAMHLYAAVLIEAREASERASAGRAAWADGPGDAFRSAMIEVEVEDAFARLEPERSEPWGHRIPARVETMVEWHRWIGPSLQSRLMRLVVKASYAIDPEADDCDAVLNLFGEIAADIYVRCLVGFLETLGEGVGGGPPTS